MHARPFPFPDPNPFSRQPIDLSIGRMLHPPPPPHPDAPIVRYPISDAIRKVIYYPRPRLMQVWFPTHGPYLYHRVPRSEFNNLCDDPSPGTYYAENIRGRFGPFDED